MDENNTQTTTEAVVESSDVENNSSKQQQQEEDIQESENTQPPEQKEDEQKEDELNLKDINDKEQAAEYLKAKNIDYSQLQEEYNRTGEISKETREKLQAAGIPDEMTDSFIEGQKAKVEAFYNDISTAVGGREEMNTVIDWARKNITKEEAQSIDAVTDPTILKIILKDLKNRMEDKEGKVPEQLTGSGNTPPVNVYASLAEMKADISDPRYRKDEAFRDRVLKKIKESKQAGTIKL